MSVLLDQTAIVSLRVVEIGASYQVGPHPHMKVNPATKTAQRGKPIRYDGLGVKLIKGVNQKATEAKTGQTVKPKTGAIAKLPLAMVGAGTSIVRQSTRMALMRI